jgi:uncharacterized protein YdhG (YjbR/CyaY superfamily)
MEFFAEWLANIDNMQHRARMEEVLGWVMATFPQLVPRTAWNQPMFTDHGTFIIGFSVAKHNMAVAPEIVAINRFSKEISAAGYDHTVGLLRIRWDLPVDYALLERIIAFNISDKTDCETYWRKPEAK